jgi:hypothetical protein
MSAEERTPVSARARLMVKAQSDFYAREDPRAPDEAFELQQSLMRELPDQVRASPAEGEKGVVTDVLIPLISSGALTAATDVFKTWLSKRPTNRKIDVEFEIDDGHARKREGEVHIDSTNVDDAVLESIAKEVLEPGK